MRISLASIEIGLQRLVEGAASWMIPGSARQSNMTNQLIEAMHANIKSFPDGSLVAPGLFIICVSPADRPGPREWQTLSENLLNTIRETAQISGYIFLHPPALNLEVDPEFPSGVFSTRAINTQIDLTPTSGLDILTPIDPVLIPVNAFLIVNGVELFNLNLPVVNIGRRSDNHLVLNDPGVSRLHAQLRARQGFYVLFDLDSARGTIVNNQRIHQKILQPGDVILLGHIPLVYGQDQEDTSPFISNISIS